MRSETSYCSFSYLKVLLGAATVGLFVWLLLIGSPAGGERPVRNTARPAAGWSVQAVKQPKVADNHPELDPNFMSKVRVPKGPDPIHNRRVGISGGPPSRA